MNSATKKCAGPGLTALLGFAAAAVLFTPRAQAAEIYHAAGTTSAAFLKLGVGARATALAGAFTGVPDDPYSIYWNPAGLASLEGEKNAGFFHNDHFQGLKQEFALYTAPASGLTFFKTPPRSGIWGLGLDYFYTPKDMERRSGANESDPLSPISQPEGKFGAYDLAFSAGYGWKPENGLSLGVSVKAIRQSIDTKTAASAALDLGVMKEYRWLGRDFTAGFSAQNIGPGIKFISRRYDLPLVFKSGISARPFGPAALLAFEADKPIDNHPSFALGVEHRLMARLALRAGYRYRHTGNELGPWSGFSSGAGISFGRFGFDYSFSPFGELGNSHRFSLNARFGAGRAVPPASGAPGPAMPGYRTVSYAVTAKPLSLSQRGARFRINAVSAASDLSAFSFNMTARGAAPAEMSVREGELPPSLLARLPSGARPVKAWEFFSVPGSVQGELSMELKAASACAEARCALLYLAGDGWKEAAVKKTEADADKIRLSVSAPFSSRYVLIEKQ